MEHAWRWLARFLNALPATRASAKALISFLRPAGYSMFMRWGSLKAGRVGRPVRQAPPPFPRTTLLVAQPSPSALAKPWCEGQAPSLAIANSPPPLPLLLPGPHPLSNIHHLCCTCCRFRGQFVKLLKSMYEEFLPELARVQGSDVQVGGVGGW